MARPRKNGLEYFPLDVDFFDDEKIVAISGEFGIKGELAAIKLLCAIYRNGYFIKWSDMLRMKMLKSLTGVSSELLDQILNRLIKWEFFDKNLFDSEKILTSRGIQKRFFEASKRWVGKDIEAKYLLVDHPAAHKGPRKQPQPSASKEKPANDTPTSPVPELPLSPEPIPAPPAAYRKTVEQEVAEFKADEAWANNVCTRYNLTRRQLDCYFDDFALKCDKPAHESLRDAKSHFCRWLNKQNVDQSPDAPIRAAERRAVSEKIAREEAAERAARAQTSAVTGAAALEAFKKSRGLNPDESVISALPNPQKPKPSKSQS